jgi:Mg-chelatase subunit ChlI
MRFHEDWFESEKSLSKRIEHAREVLPCVAYTSRDLLIIADLTSSMEVDGHRSDLVILKGARAQAAFEGRDHLTPHDIAIAAELALPHRIKSGPFRKSEMGIQALDERIETLKSETVVNEAGEETERADENEPKKKVTLQN